MLGADLLRSGGGSCAAGTFNWRRRVAIKSPQCSSVRAPGALRTRPHTVPDDVSEHLCRLVRGDSSGLNPAGTRNEDGRVRACARARSVFALLSLSRDEQARDSESFGS